MSTNIQRNQKISLNDIDKNLNKLLVGLGWKIGESGQEFDLDASAFMLKHDNEIRDKKDFVFYNNLEDPSGTLKHSGDNTVGGEGDSEQIHVELSKVPDEIGHITFVVTINKALEKQQTFGMIEQAYIRICNSEDNKEIVRYDLGKEFFSATSVVIADLVKKDGNWYFDAVGAPFSGGLEALSQDFALNLNK